MIQDYMQTVRTRLLKHVEYTGECWEWSAARSLDGYGVSSIYVPENKASKRMFAHRLSYITFKGDIPEGLHIDHLCFNRACINPEHLEAVTQAENSRRSPTVSTLNAKKTHCAKGHPYSKGNTYIRPDKSRDCRTCQRLRSNAWKKKVSSMAIPESLL